MRAEGKGTDILVANVEVRHIAQMQRVDAVLRSKLNRCAVLASWADALAAVVGRGWRWLPVDEEG